MVIVIDGYNLLKQMFPRVKGQLDKQRHNFIKQLGVYKKCKKDSIKEIIVVFDGGLLGHATREIHSGISVIFSGQKSCADEWIIKYVNKNPSKSLIIVTLDKELIEQCKRDNVDVVNVFDFYNIVNNALREDIELNLKKSVKYDVQKYDFDNFDNIDGDQKVKNQTLDLLMEQVAIDKYKKEKDSLDTNERKKGKSHKMSKKDRKRYSKIKKL